MRRLAVVFQKLICSGVSLQPDAAQFSAVRSLELDLGIAITFSFEIHQLSATWAFVLPVSSATSASPSPDPMFRTPRAKGYTLLP